MKRNAVVVGAGFGGLAAAALLARVGFNVKILEKNDQIGGRAQVYRDKGFVFDMGPSWYLMPDVFERFFAEFGKKPSDYYDLKRLDPNYRVFFSKDRVVDVPADVKKAGELFDKMASGSRYKLNEYLKVSRKQYEIAMQDFMYRDYKSRFDFFSWKTLGKGSKLHVFENIDRFTRRYFENGDIRKMLEYTMVFLGGSPKNTPALYAIMAHVDFDLGVWYPYGGFGALAQGLGRLAVEQGVEVLLNHNVTKIETVNGVATKVRTDHGDFPSDVVIANADYQHAETELLDEDTRSYDAKYWASRVMGPSAFLIFLGVNKRVKGLLHHNLYLDPSWDEHFRLIFDDPAWPSRFSYYVSCPSKTDPTVAPEGSENIFILVPVASGLEDNSEIRGRFYSAVMDHLERLTGEDLRSNIVVMRTFAHRDFTRYYNAFKGTALGMSHTLFQTAVFRPAHRSKKVGNLYYAGSYTHPGVGIPMVVVSAQIVASLIRGQHGQ